MSKKTHTAAIPITIVVTPNLKAAFADLSIQGKGGFQALMRNVSERIAESSGIARFDQEEFRRITHYATSYGEGGYQQRLRLLVAQWAAQNFDTLIHE